MKLKNFVIVLSFISVSARGAQRNLCDDLIDSGTSSPEQIKKCLGDLRFGPSEYYKEQETQKRLKAEMERIEAEDANKKKGNLEIKTFTSDNLNEEGFGKPFYAIRGDYRNHRYEEKRITEGDALCSYLGYEKAIKSIVSSELWENEKVKVDKQGLVVHTNFFGTPSDTPEIYRDEDYKFTVRKYVEITCVRRKDKTIDGSKDALKAVTEDLIMLNGELNIPSTNNSNSSINNGPRSYSNETTQTPFGYKTPDWEKDSKALSK